MRSCSVVFDRSLQGLVTIPPKPPVGNVIWKMLSDSGNERYTSWISPANSRVWSRVEFAAAWTIPNTTPWSSTGASSRCESR